MILLFTFRLTVCRTAGSQSSTALVSPHLALAPSPSDSTALSKRYQGPRSTKVRPTRGITNVHMMDPPRPTRANTYSSSHIIRNTSKIGSSACTPTDSHAVPNAVDETRIKKPESDADYEHDSDTDERRRKRLLAMLQQKSRDLEVANPDHCGGLTAILNRLVPTAMNPTKPSRNGVAPAARDLASTKRNSNKKTSCIGPYVMVSPIVTPDEADWEVIDIASASTECELAEEDDYCIENHDIIINTISAEKH